MNDRANKQYKFLPFLAMLIITNSIFVHLFERRDVFIHAISIANFLSPFFFILNDIITEIYGYRISMRVFWGAFLCRLIFFGICNFTIQVQFPYIEIDISSYKLIFNGTFFSSIFNPLVLLLAWWINARLITYWRILLKGKYFWLRSIGSSGIAEAFFAIMAIPIFLFYYSHSWIEIVQVIIWTIFFRLFFSVIFAFPASLIVNLLKATERVDLYTNHFDFNPFKTEKSVET